MCVSFTWLLSIFPGEAEYYRPLAERVLEISTDHKKEVLLTGHSLGGGLARIVGSLTGQTSISFNPPGLALSHRKYSITHKDGSLQRIADPGDLHHNSFAVVTGAPSP